MLWWMYVIFVLRTLYQFGCRKRWKLHYLTQNNSRTFQPAQEIERGKILQTYTASALNEWMDGWSRIHLHHVWTSYLRHLKILLSIVHHFIPPDFALLRYSSSSCSFSKNHSLHKLKCWMKALSWRHIILSWAQKHLHPCRDNRTESLWIVENCIILAASHNNAIPAKLHTTQQQHVRYRFLLQSSNIWSKWRNNSIWMSTGNLRSLVVATVAMHIKLWFIFNSNFTNKPVFFVHINWM